MPKLGGFDVLAVMQKERWLDDIPVMMISAEDSPSSIQKAYEPGQRQRQASAASADQAAAQQNHPAAPGQAGGGDADHPKHR